MKKRLFFTFFLIGNLSLFAQNSDSLWTIWNNKNIHDSLKINAISDIAWNYCGVNPDSAYYWASIELSLAKKFNKRNLVIDALNTMGTAQRLKGNYLLSVEDYQKILKMQQEDNDPMGLGSTYNNIGVIYQYQEDYKKALTLHQKGLEQYTKAKNKLGIAKSYSNLGIVYMGLENFEKSLECHFKANQSFVELDYTRGVSNTLNNIGTVYYKIKNYEKALEFFWKSYDIQKINGDINGYAASLANIGKIQVAQNKVNEAIKNCEEALKLSLENSFPENTKTCYDCLYDANKQKGDNKSALKYFEKFISITDSLKNSSIENQLARKEIEFEYQMKTVADSVKISEERKVVAAQLKVEQTKRYALYIGILILLAFGYFISNRLKITRRQKAIIEKQKQEVVHQKELVDEKNKEILDSINYAKRIQTAILPPKRIVKEYLPNSFILYKPKDIVAGDFYWMESKGDLIMFAAADCTGHGVPGAMVSVICNNGLNRSVKEFGIVDSGKILDKAREIVVNEFEKSDEEVKDGMDISLCVLNTKTKQLQWSGANNPLWIVRRETEDNRYETEKQVSQYSNLNTHILIEYKPDKQPIGKYSEPKPFATHQINLEEGDALYIFTDGYADQFGGEKGKKYKATKMKELLLSIQNKEMEKQRELIDKSFEDWKGDLEQLDDVCVIGVKI